MSVAADPVGLARRRWLPRGTGRWIGTGLGGFIVGTAVLVALLAPWIVPHDPFAQDLPKRLLPPFWMDGYDGIHVFGTDQLGRDYLSRLIYGPRISMLIGVSTVVTSGLIGITLGVVGAYAGGRVDGPGLFALP